MKTKNMIIISLLVIAIGGCATLADASIPRLELRTLQLSLEKLGHAEYAWRECTKRFMFCTKWEQKKEFYDLNDIETVKKLKAAGMVLNVRQKPQ